MTKSSRQNNETMNSVQATAPIEVDIGTIVEPVEEEASTSVRIVEPVEEEDILMEVIKGDIAISNSKVVVVLVKTTDITTLVDRQPVETSDGGRQVASLVTCQQ